MSRVNFNFFNMKSFMASMILFNEFPSVSLTALNQTYSMTENGTLTTAIINPLLTKKPKTPFKILTCCTQNPFQSSKQIASMDLLEKNLTPSIAINSIDTRGLSAIQTVQPTRAVLGDTVTYSSTISNNGSIDAFDVVLRTNLNDGISFDPSSVQVDGENLDIKDLKDGIPIGSLPAGSKKLVTWKGIIESYPKAAYQDHPFTGLDLYNLSKVDYKIISNDLAILLSIPSNAVVTHLPGADIQTTLTCLNRAKVAAVQTLTYSVTATNLGPDIAKNVTIYNILPEQTSYVSNTGNAIGVEVGSTGTLQFPPIDLFPGQSVTHEIKLLAPKTAGVSFTNRVFSSSTTYDVNPGNNDGSDSSALIALETNLLANPDFAKLEANGHLKVPSPGLLANDLGSKLSIISNTKPQNGTVKVMPNGGYSYKPHANFSGLDTFNYTITNDEGNLSTTTVTINVEPTSSHLTVSTPANTPITIPVLSNAFGSKLAVTSFTQPIAPGSSLSIDPDGTCAFQPAPGITGPYTFAYVATDSAGQTTTNTVTINVTPVSKKLSEKVYANETLKGSILEGAIGKDLTISNISEISLGSLDVKPDGSFTYTPDIYTSHEDYSFDYTLTDVYGQTTSNTVTITVLNPTQTDPLNETPDTSVSLLDDHLAQSDAFSNPEQIQSDSFQSDYQTPESPEDQFQSYPQISDQIQMIPDSMPENYGPIQMAPTNYGPVQMVPPSQMAPGQMPQSQRPVQMGSPNHGPVQMAPGQMPQNHGPVQMAPGPMPQNHGPIPVGQVQVVPVSTEISVQSSLDECCIDRPDTSSFIERTLATIEPEIELRLGVFVPSSNLFRKIYGNAALNYQLQFNAKIIGCTSGWINVDGICQTGSSIPLRNKTTVYNVNLNTGLKYERDLFWSISVYAGLGPNFSWIWLRNDDFCFNSNANKFGVGGIVKSGFYIKINECCFADLYVDYVYQPIKFQKTQDIGGLKSGFGIGWYF